MGALTQNERAGKNGGDGTELRKVQGAGEERTAALGVAEELGEIDEDAGGEEEDAGEVAGAGRAGREQKQSEREQEPAGGRVELHGVDGGEERRAVPAEGERVSVGDGPADGGAGAVAGAGEEGSELLDGEAEGEGRGESVGGAGRGEAAEARPEGGDGEGYERGDGGEDEAMQKRETEQGGGVEAQQGKREREIDEAGSDEGGAEGEDGEVPELGGSEAGLAGGAMEEREGEDDAERGESAVGGDEERTDVEEDRMHCSKDTCSARRGSRTRPTGP